MLSYRICGWSVINLFSQLKHGVNPIPVILAETFRSLNHCRTEEEGRFVGCAPLLDIWMQSHLKCIKDRFTRPYFPENRIQIKDFFSSQWPGPYIQQPGVDWNPQPYIYIWAIRVLCGEHPGWLHAMWYTDVAKPKGSFTQHSIYIGGSH